MAEHRPYRVISRSAKAQLLRVEFVSLTLFWIAALAINWRATQFAARTFGGAPQLGRTLLGFYAPWEWDRVVEPLVPRRAAPTSVGTVCGPGRAARARGVRNNCRNDQPHAMVASGHCA